tara:strand:- start:315 stop:503 length:189 start_codon:yes stop_codon:yes gene_type:complete
MEILLIILAVSTLLSAIFILVFTSAIYSIYPDITVGDIIDSFATAHNPTPKTQEQRRVDIIV